MKKLSTIYLERNPIYRDQMYRKKVMMTLPQGMDFFSFGIQQHSLESSDREVVHRLVDVDLGESSASKC